MTDADGELRQFGDQVRQIRLARGLSQEAMAQECGLHRTYYSAVERGERNVSLRNIVRIAHGLGVEPSRLFAGIGE